MSPLSELVSVERGRPCCTRTGLHGSYNFLSEGVFEKLEHQDPDHLIFVHLLEIFTRSELLSETILAELRWVHAPETGKIGQDLVTQLPVVALLKLSVHVGENLRGGQGRGFEYRLEIGGETLYSFQDVA